MGLSVICPEKDLGHLGEVVGRPAVRMVKGSIAQGSPDPGEAEGRGLLVHAIRTHTQRMGTGTAGHWPVPHHMRAHSAWSPVASAPPGTQGCLTAGGLQTSPISPKRWWPGEESLFYSLGVLEQSAGSPVLSSGPGALASGS